MPSMSVSLPFSPRHHSTRIGLRGHRDCSGRQGALRFSTGLRLGRPVQRKLRLHRPHRLLPEGQQRSRRSGGVPHADVVPDLPRLRRPHCRADRRLLLLLSLLPPLHVLPDSILLRVLLLRRRKWELFNGLKGMIAHTCKQLTAHATRPLRQSWLQTS